MEKFIIAKDLVKKVKRFNLTGRLIEFKIKEIPSNNEDPVSWIKGAINQVIEKGTEHLQPGDSVGFTFCSKDFKRGEGWIRFRPVEEVTYDDVWNIISSVYQSNSSALNTETFCLGVTSVNIPAGKGKNSRSRRYNTFEEECTKRRGLVVINNKDNLCLPRALVVCMAHINKDPLYEDVRRDKGKLQTQRALQLLNDAQVIIPINGCSIPELEKFQSHLQNYRIVVYVYDSNKGRNVIFKGANEAPSLNLLYHEGHYNVIVSLTAAFTCVYYCEECNIPYNTRHAHRCGGTCFNCNQSPACPQNVVNVKCDDCKRTFKGQTCYDNHKADGSFGKSTVCAEVKRCEHCFKTVKGNRQHTCGEVFCKTCNNHVPANHLCYMQPDMGKPITDDILYIFFDLETMQQRVLESGSSLMHEPNLCVFKQCCHICINTEEKICEKCGPRLQILKHNPVDRFVEFVLNQRKIFKMIVVLAHNFQGFDGPLILNHILTKTDLKPELIMRGTKIIMMRIGNVRFLDSLNYFPMALSKLPKAFGLGDGFKKGYFPHLFNTEVNNNYVGPLPEVEYYDSNSMKEGDREAFLKWYDVHKADQFDMQRDLIDYCISDVEILQSACLKFHQQLLETGNVSPFAESCTIASCCHKVYRRNFLQPNTIGIIPKNGYRWRDNQSKIAIQWLVWMEKELSIYIQHAARQKERIVAGVQVDGFSPDTNQIFEMHGCYWHGCNSCFKYNRDLPMHGDHSETLNTRYDATVAKISRLRDLGYDVIEMWECQFRQQLQKNEDLRSYTENHPFVTLTPLNPRDGFYGGRTENTAEYYKCKPNEKIKYVDICSLYPWVCKYGKFPIGHPEVYVGQECDQLDIKNINGMIKCRVLPPQVLYHPVLPTKMNNKLMFVLCRTCGENMFQHACTHSNDERAFTGTWVTDEVVKAIEKGYTILEIYEVWSYQIEQYNKSTNTGGLFTQMMNKFIGLKQQASGWPKHCNTQEEKNAYIEEFLNREDVKLEFEEIVENPGMRSLAKLMLNSFWGKLGQRENQPKTSIIKSSEEFFNLLTNPSLLVNSVLPIGEDTLVVNCEFREEVSDILPTVNVVIAAYVTTQARLKLYNYLEQLEERAIYYDTDSVVYISKPDALDVPIGEFLGDMTDELECYGAGSYIEEFASGGPKNYAYRVYSPTSNEYHEVCKVKGISLNHSSSLLVNFKTIKEAILNLSEPVYINSKTIRRTKEYEVITKNETKIYRPNSTKRKFFKDHSSLPFGYKKLKVA